MGFIALGGAFSSVMTGNMVLLGVSTGSTNAQLAISSGSAIGAYIVGVLVGARVAGGATADDEVWPVSVTRTLVIELVALVGFLVVWELTLNGRSEALQLLLLMFLAAALGMQGSAVQRFGVSGLSSTYLTGTLTTLIAGVATRQPLEVLLRHAYVLLALIVGAAVGSVVVINVEPLTPVLVVAPLAFVVAASIRLRARESRPA